MTTNTEGQKLPDIGVRSTDLGGGEYSLSFTIENRHVNLTSWNYNHRPAYHACFDLFDINLNDIYNLALAIFQVAEQIKVKGTK